MRLLTGERAWEEITEAAKATRGPSYVAVAYFGTGASELLPLKSGSILVVDLSKAALRAGRTNPSELLKYKGVEIHSEENLHAKVFVLGRLAFVGSTNASNHSADTLIEAVAESANRRFVNACRTFVKSRRGEEISPEGLKLRAKDYRPPKFRGRGGRKPKAPLPKHRPLWAVPLWVDWDDTDVMAYEAGLENAEKQLKLRSRFEIDGFSTGPGLSIRRGDRVMTMNLEEDGRHYLNPPGEVVDIGHYRRKRRRFKMIYYARVKGSRAKSLKFARKKLGRFVRGLPKSKRSKKITNARLSHAILNLWYR